MRGKNAAPKRPGGAQPTKSSIEGVAEQRLNPSFFQENQPSLLGFSWRKPRSRRFALMELILIPRIPERRRLLIWKISSSTQETPMSFWKGGKALAKSRRTQSLEVNWKVGSLLLLRLSIA